MALMAAWAPGKLRREFAMRDDDVRTYAQILVEDYGADEVWPLVDISGGTTIHAHVNSNRDGTLTGWDLQNAAGPVTGTLAPYSDGANDYGQIRTNSLESIWNGDVGAFFGWVNLDDTTQKVFLRIVKGSYNEIYILLNGTDYQFTHKAATGLFSSTVVTVDAPGPTAGWLSVGMSWNKTDNELKAFINGSRIGATGSGLVGTWGTGVGGAGIDNVFVGSYSAAPLFSIEGEMGYYAMMFDSIWSPTQFAAMHAAAATAGAD